jgi:nucleotide-binding universal stress UspA family protein
MLQLAKILLPVDFSERSVGAARYAGMLACRCRSDVTMLHVVPKEDYPLVGMEVPIDLHDFWEARRRDAQKTLDSFLTEEFHGMPMQRLLVEGDPAIQIVETAHSSGTNLIVMPTHGYGPFRRFVIGSVTAKVLHDADCPVLTGVHMEQGPTQPAIFQTILCAVDLGLQSSKALSWAADMAAELGAQLHLIHVLPPIEVGQARYFDQDWWLGLKNSAQEQVNELQEKAGTHADVIIDSGEVSKVVRKAAESVKADLLVIGRHIDSGMLGRLRAHAYAIVRESPCPVLSI